ncbi:MarR family transcriptional regulator [Streptomyces sp. NBC_01218]|uniref:MarR family winged helix-turn-helix transcriptional regulator n=1 Tax=unclassified Streptomyces TaxID=2593676 RepID=UPI0023BA3443|nr:MULTISPECIES: MarR family transcriptional regulator [unclassified Streptomyces]WEH39560.1 MarR family transcriptional regulator [Streptomyces sp. AM 2-1-1]WSQ51253.1 MarR family transcriptional regulator [Streptomyces sp. NBC_01218]
MPAVSASAQDLSRIASAITAVLPALNRALERRLAQDFAHPKPPEGHLALLRLVGERDGVTVREAADVLLVRPNNLSAMVSRLIGEGLLERTQDLADKRVAHLHLTPEATRRVEAVQALMDEYVVAALSTLTEGDLGALGSAVGALGALAGHIHPAGH